MLISGSRHFASLLPPSVSARQDSLIVDCTTVPRFGLRGPGGCEWLVSQGFDVPETVNRATLDENGVLALRLGRNEAVISGLQWGGHPLCEIGRRWSAAQGPKGYDGFRHDGWGHILVSGPEAPAFMTEIAEIDFRPAHMTTGCIAQTRALHLDVIIVRTDRFGTFGYELFLDIASMTYAVEVMTRLAAGYTFLALAEA
ncbi:hypothetical protein NOF55_02315 [Rhizobiaceae bacterium BDR2-2]|uniref:Sarcosine oxidase n=1 Tax=Ectorhizobium quercum TaxID=2965071 RepID=A0AAE3STA2_9HYPH|nr:hypothetical protein [Ectorhizobium quercum]MCX8995930.1 hypothetical protein [Ectorhizobium quercum]